MKFLYQLFFGPTFQTCRYRPRVFSSLFSPPPRRFLRPTNRKKVHDWSYLRSPKIWKDCLFLYIKCNTKTEEGGGECEDFFQSFYLRECHPLRHTEELKSGKEEKTTHDKIVRQDRNFFKKFTFSNK